MLGDLASVGLSLAGINAEKKAARAANRENKRALANAKGELRAGRTQELESLGMALGPLLEALGLAGTGENNALGELVGAESRGLKNLDDQRLQTLAGIGGDLAGRGLSGSSLSTSLQTGVNRGSGQAVGDLTAGFGTARAELARGAAGARMGALGNLASFYSDRAAREADYSKRMADLEAGVEHVVAPGIAQGYGALGGLLQGGLNGLGGKLGGLLFGGKKTPKVAGYANEEDGGA